MFLQSEVEFTPGDQFFTVRGHRVDFHRIADESTLVVQFKMERSSRDILRQIAKDEVILRPDLTAFELMVLMTETGSEEKGNYMVGFWDQAERKSGSKSFLRRCINEGAIRFNGRILKHDQPIDFPVFSIVVFPKSDKHYTTFW